MSTITQHCHPAKPHSKRRAISQFAAVIIILLIYSYPAIRARVELGTTIEPPMFAPDLTLYLNLSHLKSINNGQVLNPYYLIPVPNNGTGYLKFRTATTLFSDLNRLLKGQMSCALFIWNIFWWALLCTAALWLFERFLPAGSRTMVVFGLVLLMLLNFGVLKTLFTAWLHLPSLSRFQSIELPYMRTFIPQVPITLLLTYVGLQIEALRRKNLIIWIGMAMLQLFSLAVFPYATLMMAGLTTVSVLAQILFGSKPEAWHIPLLYGIGCAAVDGAFLLHGSVTYYAARSHVFHFQPLLLPHLVGGNWLLLCLLTVCICFSKTLAAEVKWTLVGLGITNLVLMLGDAIVPASAILLSHHSGYFLHPTAAILLTFLVSVAISAARVKSATIHAALGIAIGILLLNGTLLSITTYQQFLPYNRDEMEVTRLVTSWKPAEGDLVIARSLIVDDTCGWVALLSKTQVLYCTDAEIMLTPQQNRDIHRFREAIYLYFTGKDNNYLDSIITNPKPADPMYQLGYWAEAVSLSSEERKDGLRAMQSDLIPQMVRVEKHDIAVGKFFRQFRRVIVIDDPQKPSFSRSRLASFLSLQGQQNIQNLDVLSYVPQ